MEIAAKPATMEIAVQADLATEANEPATMEIAAKPATMEIAVQAEVDQTTMVEPSPMAATMTKVPVTKRETKPTPRGRQAIKNPPQTEKSSADKEQSSESIIPSPQADLEKKSVLTAVQAFSPRVEIRHKVPTEAIAVSRKPTISSVPSSKNQVTTDTASDQPTVGTGIGTDAKLED